MSSAPAAVLTREAPATAPQDAPRWRSRGRALLPPVLAYLVGHLLYTVAGALVAEPFLPITGRVRADSGLYVKIAEQGYELFLCDSDPILAPQFAPGAWCGTAGWFPLYPGLIRLLTSIGLGSYEAALLVTEASLLLSFVLLWRLLRNTARPVAAAVLALATLLPAGVYLHAVFPMALAGALLLGCVTFTAARRWVLAGVAGALVAAAYPMGSRSPRSASARWRPCSAAVSCARGRRCGPGWPWWACRWPGWARCSACTT
ncbi:hypothetical protein ACFQZ4_29935 [Catellatospora coxensis]